MDRVDAFVESAVGRMTSRQQVGNGRSAWPVDWMRLMLPFAGAALAAFAFLSVSGMARAATYKWVDEKGVVHYSDKMPPEALNKGSVELNRDGIAIGRTEPALTPEQLRAKAAEDERQKESKKQQDEVARRDRALLSSSKAYSEQLGKRKVGIEAKKKTEFADKPMPAILERELETIDTELARQEELLMLKQREIVAVIAKYDADKKRWRELIAAKGGEAAAVAGADIPAAAVTSTRGSAATKK